MRTPEAIEREIDSLEAQLSPENLHCDGLRSPATARRIGAALEARLKACQVELANATARQEMAGRV
jgi:hypothetical protein